jgi:hypothetical protein
VPNKSPVCLNVFKNMWIFILCRTVTSETYTEIFSMLFLLTSSQYHTWISVVIHACKFDTGSNTTDWTTACHTKVPIATLISWFVWMGQHTTRKLASRYLFDDLLGRNWRQILQWISSWGFGSSRSPILPLADLTKGALCLFRLKGSTILGKHSEDRCLKL